MYSSRWIVRVGDLSQMLLQLPLERYMNRQFRRCNKLLPNVWIHSTFSLFSSYILRIWLLQQQQKDAKYSSFFYLFQFQEVRIINLIKYSYELCAKNIKIFFFVYIPYDVAFYGEKKTCVGWEKKRNHWWNGPYVYVNKWFFIQFTKQILKKWSAQAEL